MRLTLRSEVMQRRNYPLGDEAYWAPLLKAEHTGAFDASQLVARPDY
jgi:hypothetical protein